MVDKTNETGQYVTIFEAFEMEEKVARGEADKSALLPMKIKEGY